MNKLNSIFLVLIRTKMKFLLLGFLFFIISNILHSSELRICSGGRVSTIDPALAADFASKYMVSAIYDTLLEYDYLARPYKLKAAMLEEMPEARENHTVYRFKLRKDLFFQNSGYFKGKSLTERRVTSQDVKYSFLRLADARLNSPGYWIFRDKIKGLNEFREHTSRLNKDEMKIYEEEIDGIKIFDEYCFEIHLTRSDPRFLYVLAMPDASIISYKAGINQRNDFSESPAGSGPFILSEWIRDYKMVFEKNPDFRIEYFVGAESCEDRQRKLPLLEKVSCYLVKQPLSSWLMFLRGELDISGVDRDVFDAIILPETKDINPQLKQMGIKLIVSSEFQINYVGFSFTDKKLAENLNLRKAISLAYDIKKRIMHSNYSLQPINGPIPPGVAGYDENYVNPYSKYDVEKAKEYLVLAGYPNGIDPATGKNLEFDFDLPDTSPYHRQIAEFMVDDMKKIGIKINPVLNNRPRFFQKLSEGKMQLFRLSWVGDYPDAENFLQLFYSKNAGKSNRVFYKDENFDKMFEELIEMEDSPARAAKFAEAAKYLTEQCPWIFESVPINYQLVHGWVENFVPHNFAYSRWKYISVNKEKKEELKKKFRPVKL